MSFNLKAVATAAVALSSVANAHLMLRYPIPFGRATLNNSPLNNAKPGTSESDYPCKLRSGVYDTDVMNYMKVGQPQELSFIGSASHGGGTCQLAVSLDERPTANSTFKIIQVFEGGCPIDSDGNGGTHPFTFTIPEDFPNGVSTFAWLWYNRIGNREAYMNCAPISVSGGSDSLDYYNSLPNMYVINLPTTECETGDGMSVAAEIPFPGQFIIREAAGQSITPANGPSCKASAAAMTEGVVGYKSQVITTNGAADKAPATNMLSTGPINPKATPASELTGGAGSNTSPASSSATTTSAAESAKSPSSTTTSDDGKSGALVTMKTVGGSDSNGGATSTTAATSAGSTSGASSSADSSSAGSSSATSASTAEAAPSSSSSSSAAMSSAAGTGMAGSSGGAASPSGSAGGSSSCSGSGLSCTANGKMFGLCANGVIVWQDVAAGTRCTKGQIVRRTEFRA